MTVGQVKGDQRPVFDHLAQQLEVVVAEAEACVENQRPAGVVLFQLIQLSAEIQELFFVDGREYSFRQRHVILWVGLAANCRCVEGAGAAGNG